MCIVQQIAKSVEFKSGISNFKVIIGSEQYSRRRKPQESNPLILNDCGDTLYDQTSGKVAFIPAEHTYPCSLIMVMGLIFGGIEKGDKILTELEKLQIPMENLVKYLYNNGYLLINVQDINSSSSFANHCTNVKSILILHYGGKMMNNLINDLKKQDINIGQVIHTSAMNFDKKSYHKTWFEYDNSQITKIQGDLDLSEYRI